MSGGIMLMGRDCRSQPGRAAGGVPEGEELNAVALDALVEIVMDALERKATNEFAVTRARRLSGMRRVQDHVASANEFLVERFGCFIAVL